MGSFGSVVTFTLAGGRAAADGFIHAASAIPFAPSLGDLSTTLSHPESTSHRGMSASGASGSGDHRRDDPTFLGIESSDAVLAALAEGLAGT